MIKILRLSIFSFLFTFVFFNIGTDSAEAAVAELISRSGSAMFFVRINQAPHSFDRDKTGHQNLVIFAEIYINLGKNSKSRAGNSSNSVKKITRANQSLFQPMFSCFEQIPAAFPLLFIHFQLSTGSLEVVNYY